MAAIDKCADFWYNVNCSSVSYTEERNMYKELILKLSEGNGFVKINPPCPEKKIKRAEKAVGYPFPKELRELLLELDGDEWLLWSAKEIIENVELNRESWLPFFEENFSKEEYIDRVDRFIFFAGNGCGDYYCYRVRNDGVADESVIYIWEHEMIDEKCCWRAVASNMAEFITRYYKGEI